MRSQYDSSGFRRFVPLTPWEMTPDADDPTASQRFAAKPSHCHLILYHRPLVSVCLPAWLLSVCCLRLFNSFEETNYDSSEGRGFAGDRQETVVVARLQSEAYEGTGTSFYVHAI